MNRRNFIQKTSITAAGITAAFHLNASSQNQKIKMGLIGSGWYGMVVAKSALKSGDVEITAICDVDTEHLKNGAAEIEGLQGKKPEEYKDYLDLLEMKELDAVIIGTPPHWHALQFIAACQKGLDIFCEKPLSYDVMEGLAMIEAAEKAGNIVQVGFQRRQSLAFKKAKELISQGKLGKVHQIEAQINYVPVLKDNTIQPPPASLDWNTWCGPAPKLEYRPNIGHMAWRLEKEYGNGHLVDWGIHHIDIIRQIMDFGIPASFQTFGGMNELEGQITTPDTLLATMNFDQCPVIWKHRLWGAGDVNPQFNNGIFFYGDQGTLFASDNKLVLTPAGKNKQPEEMEIPTPAMQDQHVADFVNAVKAKDKKMISCTVQDAAQSTAAVQLAMISYYTGTNVKWNDQKKTIADNKKASDLLARNYRSGYQHPGT